MNGRSDPSAILVPLDGSGLAWKALEAAIEIAREAKARVHLLHVVPRLEEYARHPDLFDPLVRELDRVGHEIVAEAAARAGAAGVGFEEALAHGYPAEEIVGHAETRRVDLIAMGSRGLTPKGSHVLGSVSYQVAMRAPCSVLVAKSSGLFDRIVLAVDGSQDARRAAEIVAALGPPFRSDVLLLFVVPERPEGAFTLASTPAEPFLLDTEKRLRAAGLRVSRAVGYGHPAQEILKAAQGRTLIVLGARGRNDLALDYVGSVADKILRNGRASVLLAR